MNLIYSHLVNFDDFVIYSLGIDKNIPLGFLFLDINYKKNYA